MSLIIPANSLAGGGYAVDNSLRFNSGSSDYLSRTPSGGNYQISTFSGWVKRSILGTQQHFFSFSPTDNNQFNISFSSNDTLQVYSDDVPTLQILIRTNRVFRDVSAWYHVFVAYDTTQGTASNRVKIYINGIQETSFSTATYPSLNANLQMNGNVNLCTVGTYRSPYYFYNGYLSEFNWIDGQALTPTDFGEFDEDTGIWKPIAYEGTYGTNGFYLDFENSGSLGADQSGNGNNFTVNNLTSIDQVTDTPTNNFCTLNSLDKHASLTPTEGNLAVSNGTTTYMPIKSTFAVSAGAWYCETKITSGSENIIAVYLSRLDGSSQSSMDSQRIYYNTSFSGGSIVAQGVFTYSQNSVGTATTNDIIGVALDVTNGTLKFYKNGSQIGSTITNSAISSNEWQFGTQLYEGGLSWNFGNPPYSANGYTDGAGYGNFSYAVPSGYYSLCTKNLAQYG